MILIVPPTSLRFDGFREKELFDLMGENDHIDEVYRLCLRDGLFATVCHDLVMDELLMVMMAIYLQIPFIEVWHDASLSRTHDSPV